MNFSGFKTYLKFLSRHRVYTFVSVAGFALSLAFVIILAFFAKTQVSMDSFHENRDRIYMLKHGETASHANPVGDYVKDLCPEVEAYTRVSSKQLTVETGPGFLYEGAIMLADPDFFNIFSFPLIEGDEDEVLKGSRSAVLSRSFAEKIFPGADPLGKTLTISDEQITVTGIMEDFPYHTHFSPHDAVVSYNMLEVLNGGEWIWGWWNAGFDIYFLERENAVFPSKKDLLLEKFKEDYWMFVDGFSEDLEFVKLEDIYFIHRKYSSAAVKEGNIDTTRLYMVIALMILVIAVLNYVNMTVAQAGFRGKEAAVRKLMGSGRARIILQHLGESLIMTTVALGLALLAAFLAEPLFDRLLATNLNLGGSFDTEAVAVLAAGLILISFTAGLIPALAVSSFRPLDVIKGRLTRRVKTGYSKVLIVFQFTVCIALLVSTFFIKKQADYMIGQDLGFNTSNILLLGNVVGNIEQLAGPKEKILQVPGVEAVGFASNHPLKNEYNLSFTHNEQPYTLSVIWGDSVMAEIFGLTFEETMPVETGRQDEYIYVNRMAYNFLQPDAETGYFEGLQQWYIAGIVNDFNSKSLHSAITPVAFQYLGDEWRWPSELVVKLSSGNVYETAEKIREVYGEFHGGKYYDWYFADERVYGWYENERRMTGIMGTFTLLSIVIMVMGVFAMSVYMIRQKEKEIGIRKVSGATAGEILGMLNLESMSRVLIAFVIACPVAWYGISRWLRTFAYRIEITPGVFILAGIIVTVLCLASVSWQTLRAARANPVDSLKSE